jgi:hypothetical protein
MTKGRTSWCSNLGRGFAGLILMLGLAVAAQTEPAARCSAQDARGKGQCERVLGYAWDGRQCVSLSGCSCVGTDCAGIFQKLESCQAAYAHCSCRPQRARARGACAKYLGSAWDGKRCTGLSGCECEGADCKDLFPSDAACEEAHRACHD